ncbi:MAG: hypothetical protein WC661_21655 [Opitutaceae bacterium]|jgi:hypothetical protein
MKHLSILIFFCIFLSACRPKYTLTKETILAGTHAPGVEVIKTGGAEGPFISVGGFVGNPNQKTNLSWKTSKGETKVEWPAEPGYYFQIDRYQNADADFFWILLRLPNKK